MYYISYFLLRWSQLSPTKIFTQFSYSQYHTTSLMIAHSHCQTTSLWIYPLSSIVMWYINLFFLWYSWFPTRVMVRKLSLASVITGIEESSGPGDLIFYMFLMAAFLAIQSSQVCIITTWLTSDKGDVHTSICTGNICVGLCRHPYYFGLPYSGLISWIVSLAFLLCSWLLSDGPEVFV